MRDACLYYVNKVVHRKQQGAVHRYLTWSLDYALSVRLEEELLDSLAEL